MLSDAPDHRMFGQFSHPIRLPMPHPLLCYCQMVNLHLLDYAMETVLFFLRRDGEKMIKTDCDKDNFFISFSVQ